jgi:hypothetical protein
MLSRLLVMGLALAAIAPASGPAVSSEPVTIILAPQLVGGQTATLAMLDGDGHTLAGAAVELSDGQERTTDASGRAEFTVSAKVSVLIARVSGRSASGAAAAVLTSRPATELPAATAPPVISMRDRFVVSGAGLQGDADANQAQVGGAPAAILAASPVALVLLAGPGAKPGPTQIMVRVPGGQVSVPTNLVALEMDSALPELAAREKSVVRVTARGTSQPLKLEVSNLTPDVVHFNGGERQRVMTSGGADNFATISLRGKSAGDFSLSVRLAARGLGLPDIEAARQLLQAALLRAPQREARHIEQLIQRLGQAGASRQDREEVDRLAGAAPQGEYAWLLQATREVLSD